MWIIQDIIIDQYSHLIQKKGGNNKGEARLPSMAVLLQLFKKYVLILW